MNDKYVSKGDRIAIERKRLGYTQQQIAELCEVTRVQWGRYERGDSELGGRVLKHFVELGASASFILTGEKSDVQEIGKIKESDVEQVVLTKDEITMIQMYRGLSDKQRETLKQTARLFGESV